MKMKLVRINSTGREYAVPTNLYSYLPCFRIKDGKPAETSFSYDEMMFMVSCGTAEIVGQVKLSFTLERSK